MLTVESMLTEQSQTKLVKKTSAPRRVVRRPSESLTITLDAETVNILRCVIAEGQRKGTIPDGYTIEQMARDAAHERGMLLLHAICGFELFDIRIDDEPFFEGGRLCLARWA